MAQAAGEVARTLGWAEAHRLGLVAAPAQWAEVAAAEATAEAARSCRGSGSSWQRKTAANGVLLLLLLHALHKLMHALMQLCGNSVRHADTHTRSCLHATLPS